MSLPIGRPALDEEVAREAAASVRAHGGLDLVLAGLYAFVGFHLAPSRHPGVGVALGVVVALLAIAGVALLTRARHARRVAQAAQAALLGFAAVTLLLLVASAAYLRGVYGPLGQGMAAITLVVAALVLELCGLLPILQLRMLARPAVRRLLERPPSPHAAPAPSRALGGEGG